MRVSGLIYSINPDTDIKPSSPPIERFWHPLRDLNITLNPSKLNIL